MELEELKSLIKEAFKDVNYPGDDHIAGCSRSALPGGCHECDGIAAHFKGTTWQEHTRQTLNGYEDAITLFHSEVLHYYLLAFMLAEIDYFLELTPYSYNSIENIYDSIEFNYSPNKYIKDRSSKNVSLLSTQQREAVIEYFKCHCTDEGVYNPDKSTLEIIDFVRS